MTTVCPDYLDHTNDEYLKKIVRKLKKRSFEGLILLLDTKF